MVAVLGCGGKEAAPPEGGSASGSAPVAKGSGSAAGSGSGKAVTEPVAVVPVAKPGELLDDKTDDAGRALVFEKHVPQLPAISPDGKLIADFDSDASGPMIPWPFRLSIGSLDGKGKAEQLELVDMKLAEDEARADHNWDTKAPSAAIIKKLRERGAAAIARLRSGNFASLVRVELAITSGGETLPTKIGSLTLGNKEDDDQGLELTLTDATGKVLHREKLKGFETSEKPESFAGGACGYRPSLSQALLDQGKKTLYLGVVFRHHDDCNQQPYKYIVWTLPESAASVADKDSAIADVVKAQFDDGVESKTVFAPGAQQINAEQIAGGDAHPFLIKASNEQYTGHQDKDVQVVLSRDGKSAWASLTTALSILPRNEPGRDDPWRASSVLAKTPAGWRIVATTWTEPVSDAKATEAAKAGKAVARAFTADKGDASLRAAFAKLVSDGVDEAAAARPDLVAIGSAAGERTVGGKLFARGWNGAWKGHATVHSSIARAAPSGTTGWVAASIELPKSDFKIPFQVFCVFDKTTAGTWSLVHIHFSF